MAACIGGGGGGGGISSGGGGGGGGASLVPAGGSVTAAPAGIQPHVLITYTTPTQPGGGSQEPISGKGGGTTSTTSTPSVSAAGQSASRWRAGSALAQISSKRAPVGTTFSFTLNEAATVTFSFVQRVAGRKVHGHCVTPTGRNRHKPACKLSRVAGVLTFSAHAGVNKVRFAGRISSAKRLALGSYTLQILARNAQGNRSKPQSLSFTIVK